MAVYNASQDRVHPRSFSSGVGGGCRSSAENSRVTSTKGYLKTKNAVSVIISAVGSGENSLVACSHAKRKLEKSLDTERRKFVEIPVRGSPSWLWRRVGKRARDVGSGIPRGGHFYPRQRTEKGRHEVKRSSWQKPAFAAPGLGYPHFGSFIHQICASYPHKCQLDRKAVDCGANGKVM